MLNREINNIFSSRELEFGNPNRAPSGTMDEAVIIQWKNQIFAEREDGIKRVYCATHRADGTENTARFRFSIENKGSNRYNYLNRFFIMRLFYESNEDKSDKCRAKQGLNCIPWENNVYEKRVKLENPPGIEIDEKFNLSRSSQSIDNLYLEIPPATLASAYKLVENQIFNGGGRVYLEIRFFWQEYSNDFWYVVWQSKDCLLFASRS